MPIFTIQIQPTPFLDFIHKILPYKGGVIIKLRKSTLSMCLRFKIKTLHFRHKLQYKKIENNHLVFCKIYCAKLHSDIDLKLQSVFDLRTGKVNYRASYQKRRKKFMTQITLIEKGMKP